MKLEAGDWVFGPMYPIYIIDVCGHKYRLLYEDGSGSWKTPSRMALLGAKKWHKAFDVEKALRKGNKTGIIDNLTYVELLSKVKKLT